MRGGMRGGVRGGVRLGIRIRRVLTITVGLALLCVPPLWAHLMPAQQGTLNVLDNAVFAAAALPVSAFPDADDDHDGRLSLAELRAHDATLRARITARFRITDAEQAATLDTLIVSMEPDDRAPGGAATGSRHFLALLKVSFARAPRALQLTTDIFGRAPSEQQLTIKATRGRDAEVAILSAGRTSHQFFGAPLQVLREFVGIGVRHILGGADHLLFLLTIIAAAVGWRYWAGVLTSFTVAHSITLTVALLGWVRLPARVVEPLIAASIVLMAVLNLRGRAVVVRHRVAIVFGCGLLHGLGFASAMADIGLSGAYRAMSLVGFNVGIEVGQALFLSAVLAIALVLRRVGAGRLTDPRVPSAVAAVCGSVWLVQRLLGV